MRCLSAGALSRSVGATTDRRLMDIVDETGLKQCFWLCRGDVVHSQRIFSQYVPYFIVLFRFGIDNMK